MQNRKLILILTGKYAFSAIDRLIKQLNTYYGNIKLTLDINWSKFSDAELIRENKTTTAQVFTKSDKFLVHCTSKVPIRCKQLLENFIGLRELHPSLIQKLKQLKIST